MKRFIVMMFAILMIPMFLIGCNSNNNNANNNNDNSENVQDAIYEQYINTLEIAINNISNNNNDILNGYGVYNTRTEEDGEIFSTYFESEKMGTHYYGSYYYRYDDQYIKHYSWFNGDGSFGILDTYAKLDNETYIKHNHYENKNTLTEYAITYFSMVGGKHEFSKDSVISCYEINNNSFVVVCKKYNAPNITDEYLITEYTIENNKLISIDTKHYDTMDKVYCVETVEIKYNITVDAYEEYYKADNKQ